MTPSELTELADAVGIGYHRLLRSGGVDSEALRLKVRKESLE
jgi:hypothetical protein